MGCAQDKNKYQSPEYRLVVRFTNTKVICQIAYALVDGDRIMCQAQSTELGRYGISVGLKNYAAAYCTGLLCARRLLQKIGLDELYEGNTEVDAEVVSTEYDNKTYYVDEVDVEGDGLEELYESVHEKIREDPSPGEKKDFSPDKSFKRKPKLTYDERKAAVEAKKQAKRDELAEDSDDE